MSAAAHRRPQAPATAAAATAPTRPVDAAAAAAAPRNGYAEERRNDELVVALESDAVLSMHSLMRDETPTRMRALLFRELARTSVPLMDGRPEPPPAQP